MRCKLACAERVVVTIACVCCVGEVCLRVGDCSTVGGGGSAAAEAQTKITQLVDIDPPLAA